MRTPRERARFWLALHSDQRGLVMAEYGVVLVLVSLVTALALASLGVPLFSLYSYTEFILGLPVP
jgi:Flp pilus assembly pilin Flp